MLLWWLSRLYHHNLQCYFLYTVRGYLSYLIFLHQMKGLSELPDGAQGSGDVLSHLCKYAKVTFSTILFDLFTTDIYNIQTFHPQD